MRGRTGFGMLRAMNTPTVAIFGPTVPALGFGPLAERRAVVQQDTLACRPCHAHGPMQCPLGHWKCMGEIGADTVAKTALERAYGTSGTD